MVLDEKLARFVAAEKLIERGELSDLRAALASIVEVMKEEVEEEMAALGI